MSLCADREDEPLTWTTIAAAIGDVGLSSVGGKSSGFATGEKYAIAFRAACTMAAAAKESSPLSESPRISSAARPGCSATTCPGRECS